MLLLACRFILPILSSLICYLKKATLLHQCIRCVPNSQRMYGSPFRFYLRFSPLAKPFPKLLEFNPGICLPCSCCPTFYTFFPLAVWSCWQARKKASFLCTGCKIETICVLAIRTEQIRSELVSPPAVHLRRQRIKGIVWWFRFIFSFPSDVSYKGKHK